MSSAPDFRTLLSKPADDVKRPKPLPAGTYHGVITQKEYVTSKQKQTPGAKFTLKVQQPGADVAPEDLEGIDLSSKTLSTTLWLTQDSAYRVVELAQSCGYPTEGRSLGELIEDLGSNTPVVMSVTQRNGTNPEDIFNDVDRIRGEA